MLWHNGKQDKCGRGLVFLWSIVLALAAGCDLTSRHDSGPIEAPPITAAFHESTLPAIQSEPTWWLKPCEWSGDLDASTLATIARASGGMLSADEFTWTVEYAGDFKGLLYLIAQKTEKTLVVKGEITYITKKEDAQNIGMIALPRGLEETATTLVSQSGKSVVAPGSLAVIRDTDDALTAIRQQLAQLRPGVAGVGLVLARRSHKTNIQIGGTVSQTGSVIVGSGAANTLALAYAPSLTASTGYDSFDLAFSGLVQTGVPLKFSRGTVLRVRESIRYENGETTEGQIKEIPLGFIMEFMWDWSGALGWSLSLETLLNDDLETEKLALSGSVPELHAQSLVATLRGDSASRLLQLLGYGRSNLTESVDIWIVTNRPPSALPLKPDLKKP